MRNKKKVLWISPYAPYDGVAHGGGKTHNYYIKYFQKSDKYDITLLSLCLNEETDKLDLKQYGIKHYIFSMDNTILNKFQRLLISGLAYKNPLDRYGGVCLPYERIQMKRLVKNYRKANIQPEIIILQWTFSLMFIESLKHCFPEAFIVAIEEDVTFLNYQRKMNNAANRKEFIFWKKRYEIMHRIELCNLHKADLIVTNNPKDSNLLIKEDVDKQKIFTSAPYIDNYLNVNRKEVNKDILFFGAMSRPENYLSAVWFIRNVMPLIKNETARFVIVGGNPPALLRKYADHRIVLTGYVEDVSEFFQNSICMVAPLVGGAGIKIKVLEAMSAGIPVLTNEIGIEGIEAVDQREYFHCETPEEYANCINAIVEGKICTDELSYNAKEFILRNYNLSEKLEAMIEVINQLSERKER